MAEKLCDRIAIIKQGRLIRYDRTENVVGDSSLESVFLELEAEKKLLIRAVNQLPPREKLIVQLRFGLGHPDGEEKTQKEVADILGISQSYISRLEKKIMIRLKRELDRYEV